MTADISANDSASFTIDTDCPALNIGSFANISGNLVINIETSTTDTDSRVMNPGSSTINIGSLVINIGNLAINIGNLAIDADSCTMDAGALALRADGGAEPPDRPA